jgi:carbonic anhydrase
MDDLPLTIIPGMVKTTANVLGGGRTQWANFYNACFLLTFLLLGRDLIDMVPLTVLAAILVFIGYNLCSPRFGSGSHGSGRSSSSSSLSHCW